MYRSLTGLIFTLLTVFQIQAQNTCEYQLILNHSEGTGWQDAEVNFFIESIPTIYQLNGATDTFSINLVDGDSISIEYITQGAADEENNIQLLDSDGRVLLDVTDPSQSVLLEAFAFCPSCPAIVLNSVVNVDSFDNRILIDWEPSDSLGIYLIEYARCGFLTNPDSVNTVMSADSEATITDLSENTCYEYQIALTCQSGDTSIFSGPHTGNTIFTNDVGISGVFGPQPGNKCNYSDQDTLFVIFKNYGAAPQTLVPFDFIISKGNLNSPESVVMMPDDGLYTGILVKDSCLVFPFETSINIADPGEYMITTWTELETDGDISNDTFSYTFSHSSFLPFVENFDDSDELPFRWTSDESNPIIGGVVSSELGPLNSRFLLSTERYGYIESSDSLSFEYFFDDITNSGTPASLTVGDRLLIEVSRDCGSTYEEIDMLDGSDFDTDIAGLREHKISLANFAGEIISFRFSGLRGGSSFRLLLDNINVFQCKVEDPFALDALVINTSQAMEENGSITVRPTVGIGPYTFNWSTGTTEVGEQSTIINLGTGTYTVTITDQTGCFQTGTFNIGVLLNTLEFADLTHLDLFPNPTGDILNVDISLERPLELNVRIFNLIGQEVYTSNIDAGIEHRMPISVSNFDSGIYFLQLSSEAGQVTERFVVER